MQHYDLLLRQQQLLTHSAQLRVKLGQQAQVLQGPLALADQARATFNWLLGNPVWPMLAGLALLGWKPLGVLTWGSRLWWLWRGYQKLRLWLAPQR